MVRADSKSQVRSDESDFGNFALRPMSWNHTTPRDSRAVRPGFAGHINDAADHYGSSYFAGVPLRGGGHQKLPHKGGLPLTKLDSHGLMHGGLLSKDAELHMVSSHEVGRNAWNVDWAKRTVTVRGGTPRGATPRSADRRQRSSSASASYRPMSSGSRSTPRGGTPVQGTPRSFRRQGQAEEEALPSWRHTSFVPMSRDPRGPSAVQAQKMGGIRPGYTGHIPGVMNHYGSTHVGGSYQRQDVALPGRDKGPPVTSSVNNLLRGEFGHARDDYYEFGLNERPADYTA